MGLLDKLFSASPFEARAAHTRKVHDCVELVPPLVDALVTGDTGKIDELQNLMSRTEYEADLIKTEIRERLSARMVLSVGRDDLSRHLAYQDDVADAAEDFAVILSIRKTAVHAELEAELRALHGPGRAGQRSAARAGRPPGLALPGELRGRGG